MSVNVRASTGCLFITDHRLFLPRFASIVSRRDKRIAAWLIAVEIIPRIVRVVDTLKTTWFIKDRGLRISALKLIIEMQSYFQPCFTTWGLIATERLFCRLCLSIYKLSLCRLQTRGEKCNYNDIALAFPLEFYLMDLFAAP